MKNLQFNYIVVGQGIAGTALAYSLLKANKTFIVIDDNTISSCSRVAAGNYNPVVFKRLVLTWMANEVIPFAEKFYTEAQQFLSTEFYWKKEIVKYFTEDQERTFWLKRTLDDVGNYLNDETLTNYFGNIINNPGGCGIVKEAGNVFSEKYLADFRDFFLKQNLLLSEKFNFDDLIVTPDSVAYKNITAEKIIFCDGWKVLENPYFKHLPFRPAKGELLTVKIENLTTDKILHKGIYLLPIGNDLFIVGATYEWQDLNDLPTEKGKKELLHKLEAILKVPYKIVDHKAGVRPSTKDIRPIVGIHPQHPSVGIFNGMGTKGITLAPYFAKQLIDFLTNGTHINKEVDINRFNQKT